MVRKTWLCLAFVVGCTSEPVAVEHTRVQQWDAFGTCTSSAVKVDVLLVVDNSASMADQGEVWADNLRAFGHVYAASELDYRIAVTTTDVGGPDCEGPRDDGRFLTEPCTENLGAFEVGTSHESEAVDVRAACLDRCENDRVRTTPTLVRGASVAKPRPWLERTAGVPNISREPGDYLSCVGQPGFSGCEAESPIAAALLALERAEDPADPAYGFLREDAGLSIVFIGDEDDCSRAPGSTEPLASAGASVSAACWRAGSQCVSEGETRHCEPSDDPRMLDLEQFFDRLQTIEARKQEVMGTDEQRVFVSGVAGVSLQYPNRQPLFGPGNDPRVVEAFGVGPGCLHGGRMGTPPVRTREITDAFEPWQMDLVSACGSSWVGALACVPDEGLGYPLSMCLDVGALGTDVSTETLDEHCIALEERNGESHRLPPCVPACSDHECSSEHPAWVLPQREEACVVWRSTEHASLRCAEDGGAEVAVLHRDTLWDATCLEVTCSVSL